MIVSSENKDGEKRTLINRSLTGTENKNIWTIISQQIAYTEVKQGGGLVISTVKNM